MVVKKAKSKKLSKSRKAKKKPLKKIKKKAVSKKASVKVKKKAVQKKVSVSAAKKGMVSKADYEKLKAEYKRMQNDYAECLWAFVKWCGVAFNYVGKELGEEEVKKIPKYLVKFFENLIFEKGGVHTLKTLKWFVDVLGSDFKWVEDDEKIILKGVCNSGGRLEREGISKRNKEGVSYYCSHCKQWYEDLAKQWYDLDIKFQYKPGGQGCTFTFMK